MELLSIVGHHGTSDESARAITKNNFNTSKGDKEWLGDGAYFFVDGVSSKTVDLAKKWAIAQAWNRQERKYNYNSIGIIESIIEVKRFEFLDLTVEDGVEILNYLIEKFESKMASICKKLDYADGYLINMARKEGILPLEVVKGNFYIKFERERILRLNLRTNNCTICVVYNPTMSIKKMLLIKTEPIE